MTVRAYPSGEFTGSTNETAATEGYINVVATGDELRIYLRCAGAGTSFFDNVSVKEVTFDESDGTLTLFEHPDNIPRVEYDADGNRLGLLVEESRTNLQTYSEDFSNSSWTKSGSSVSAATSITAPDSTTNSFKLIESSSTEAHRVQGAQAAGGTTSTMSCFMKKAERSWGNINFAGLTNGQAWFDLENGVLGTVQSAVTAKIEEYGNGWYRCSVTATPTSAATTDIKVANADNVVSYAGDGASGIYIFGAQTEAGAFPTSYIKTTGSTATRSADVASIPVADFGYNQSAGSIVIESQTFDITDVGRNFSLSDGTSSNVIRSQSQATNHLIVINSGSVTANLDAGAYSNNVFSKLGGAFAKDDIAASMDGGAVVTDTSSSIPAVTKLNIGGRYDGGLPLNGHIKSIKYYPRRLTNAQLQEITS